jgi:hypothetical protein
MSAIGSNAAVPGFSVWPGNFPAAFGQQQTFSYVPTGSGTHGLIVVVPQG